MRIPRSSEAQQTNSEIEQAHPAEGDHASDPTTPIVDVLSNSPANEPSELLVKASEPNTPPRIPAPHQPDRSLSGVPGVRHMSRRQWVAVATAAGTLFAMGAGSAVGKGPELIVSKYGGNSGRLDSSPRAARMFMREKKRGGSQAAARLLALSVPAMQAQVLRFPEQDGTGYPYKLVPGSDTKCKIDGSNKPLELKIGSSNDAVGMKRQDSTEGDVYNTRTIFVASANKAVKLTFHFEVPAAKDENGKDMKGQVTRTIVPCADVLQGAQLGYTISRPLGNNTQTRTAPRGAFYWITNKNGQIIWHDVRKVAGIDQNVSTAPNPSPIALSAHP